MVNKIIEFFVGKKDDKSIRVAFWVLFAFGLVALVAALTLSVEELIIAKNPDALLSCDLNAVISCATVMQTWQASVFFGIPNMFFGLIAFTAVVVSAVAYLWGGARYNRFFLLALNTGLLFGFLFALWLFYSSVYSIGVLCPWCLVVTFSSTMMFAASTYISLKNNLFNFKKTCNDNIQKFLTKGYYQLIFASFVVILIALVFIKFGDALFA